MISVPFLDLAPIHRPIEEELQDAVLRVLKSNYFIGGSEVRAFEKEVAKYCGVDNAIGVSSGTDALLVSLMAMGIQPGDEVITTPFTFFATAGSVVRFGAKPVFVDIEPDTFNLNPANLEDAITERTKAIIPVHLFGQMADMKPIMVYARDYRLSIIEDAAQAIGAQLKGWKAGAVGNIGCFSFFPSKNLGGIGDGGLVTTNDDTLADKIRTLREHGAERRYYHTRIGGNFRLDAIQATALRVKLKCLDDWHEMRRQNAAFYREALADLQSGGYVMLPIEKDGYKHVYNQFVIRAKDRDGLQGFLTNHNIGTAVYYPTPLHLQLCFAYLGYKPGDLPVSEQAAREVLALPIFPGLTEEQANTVVDCIKSFYKQL